MRVLVIGYGSIGKRHADILKNQNVQVAVVSRRKVDFQPCYTNIESALGDFSPDYIVVASRTIEHREDLQLLSRLGFTGSVLVEKPLTGDCDELINPAFKHFFIGYNLRFHPLIQAFKKKLAGRRIFSLHAYVGQYLPDWRPGTDYRQSYSAKKAQGGGVLRDLSHELDLVLWLAGPCRTVTAIGGHKSDLEIDSDDIFCLLLKQENSAVTTVILNYLDSTLRRELIAQTDQGSLRANLATGELFSGSTCSNYEVNRDYTYTAQHKEVLSGNIETCCTFDQGSAVMKLICAAERAASENRWIELGEA